MFWKQKEKNFPYKLVWICWDPHKNHYAAQQDCLTENVSAYVVEWDDIQTWKAGCSKV